MRSLIISISSDIGQALALHFRSLGYEVAGTYRRDSPSLLNLKSDCSIELIHCDLNDPDSIDKAIPLLKKPWDQLILAPGTLEPIGTFEETNFQTWKEGLNVNLLAPLQIVHALLPSRQKNARVLFFAGAGTNGPAPRYSCYALSKIGLIKMCEQLASEISDASFSIVGPGWVKTKIHKETLRAASKAGANLERTIEQLDRGDLISMERVIECCDWILSEDSQVVNGRNFSLVHDAWKSASLRKALIENPDLYKLRRYQSI